jgi:hypothetical protein
MSVADRQAVKLFVCLEVSDAAASLAPVAPHPDLSGPRLPLAWQIVSG